MSAFVIPVDDGGGEEVVFLKSLEDLDPEINGAKPAPEFDQYEAIGYVPTKTLIENGWHLYCDECDRRSDDEEDGDDHEGRSVVG